MDTEKLALLLFPSPLKTPEEWEKIYPPRDLPQGAVVTRMAPSPTGFVHLGNIIQGLTSERMAHQSGGVLFLRVEDTDAKREVKGAVDILIQSLKYFGIEFDEGATINGDFGKYGPYRQRQRREIYHTYARELVLKGKAYPCFCSEEELSEMRTMQKDQGEKYFGYFGKWAKWRDRPIEDIEAELNRGTPWVLRFRSEGSDERKIRFTDLVKGDMELTENSMDSVLLKADGIPTYHFAHAVDDHLMRTTHVVRGDEWLPSLPFHIELFSALGFKLPKYAHIGPLQKMDGESKRKLSKRKDPEFALSYYRAQGYPTESVYEYVLGVLNSNFEDFRRANPTVPAQSFPFSAKKLNPAGSLFDSAKLRDISKNVISTMTAEKVYDEVLAWSREYDPDLAALLAADPGYALSVLSIGRTSNKPRKDIAIWSEAKHYMSYFYDSLFAYEDEAPAFPTEDIRRAIEGFVAVYDENDDGNAWFDKVKQITLSLDGYTCDMKAFKASPQSFRGNVADVSMFLRYAVTGRLNAPDLCTVMKILGKKRTADRLQAYKNSL